MATPITRTVKVPVYQTQQNWTPRSQPLRWAPRNPQTRANYYLDVTDLLADVNATIQNIGYGLPDTDGALTVASLSWGVVAGQSWVSVFFEGGTVGKTYTVVLQPFLSGAQEVDAIPVLLPIFQNAPVIPQPNDTVLLEGTHITIGGLSFPVSATQ